MMQPHSMTRPSTIPFWRRGFFDWPEMDRDEVHKRRLYTLLVMPTVLLLLTFGSYNIFRGDALGGWLDTAAAAMLVASIVYLQHARRAWALYRLNTLVLFGVMFYWMVDGGTDGERALWAMMFPLVAHFMLGCLEGMIWNIAAFSVWCIVFFVNIPITVFPYSQPLASRFLCVYVMISLITYCFETVRKEFWDAVFSYEAEKKALQDKLARSQKMEALGLLAGGVAHDLNNIMSGLVTYPDYLLSTMADDDAMTSPLKRIADSGQKAAAIVDELLTLARRSVTDTCVIDFDALVSEYLDSPEYRELRVAYPSVEIVTLQSPEPKRVDASGLHLKKCVMNLITNAVDAIVEDGRVIVSTAACRLDQPIPTYSDVVPGDYVVLRVEDNGVGITDEDLPHIFEPFYTRKKMGRSGTGLGMSVVWGAVQDHGGYIDVTSDLGHGTVIQVYLPACEAPVPTAQEYVPIDAFRGNGESILFVDDIDEQRVLAAQMLSELGYRVNVAESGEAAVRHCQHHRVALVVLDMIMDPGIDGLETYRQLLKMNPNQNAILISGYSESNRTKQALALGAGAYVKKPYVLYTLAKTIRTELDKHAAAVTA